ncbi:unnamed protein product [Lymnaea stagnalis]|uniref:Transcriptional repressor NF-X1 n=1 Tax=Lymnaea stagnalis TaxID=6523 RepID=A0AAV2H411_LYMST
MSWQSNEHENIQATGHSLDYQSGAYMEDVRSPPFISPMQERMLPPYPVAMHHQNGRFSNNDFLPSAEFSTGPQPIYYQPYNNLYDAATNLNYIPGVPLHTNEFYNTTFDNPRNFSQDILQNVEVVPGTQFDKTGQQKQQNVNSKRANGRFHNVRGRRNQGNSYGYYDYSQQQDGYYEASLQQGYHPRGRQGGKYRDGMNHKSRELDKFSSEAVASKLGNGDGKYHRPPIQSQALSESDGEKREMKTKKQSETHYEDINNPNIQKVNSRSTPEDKQLSNTRHENVPFKRSTFGQDGRLNYSKKSYREYHESESDRVEKNSREIDHNGPTRQSQSEKTGKIDSFKHTSQFGKDNTDRVRKSTEAKERYKSDSFTFSRGKGNENNPSSSNVAFYGGLSRRVANDKSIKNTSTGQESLENDESQRGTLTEQLSKNRYECMVCCDNIRVEAPVWSCSNCYHVFHLTCIQKWARASISKDAENWRCPGCQNISVQIPSQYRCFCGHKKDPKYYRGETPHSCGEQCRKRRKGDCKHPCTLLCHPGPCPPCSSTVWLKCDCEKTRKNVRCAAAVRFKCDEVCGRTLECAVHQCTAVCHSGPCPPCKVTKSQECFCQKITRQVQCGTEEFRMAYFSCEQVCGRTLDCGNHVCEEVCHPCDCAPCSLMPSSLQFCCCGKTPLIDLKVTPRSSCLDLVPTCGNICNKPMACGLPSKPHLCEKKCHNGDCGPCSKETLLKCECGAIEKNIPCEIAATYNEKNPFKCQRRCGKKKTCGRHKCSDKCCVKDIHICEIVCGQKLSCGIHKCEELCHRGNCKRCLQASFDELTCYCGAEVLEPPIPCGTRRPDCRNTCTRQHDCDHPVRHNCHGDEICPPCTELTDKMCVGGHMMRKNVPCHMINISCGYPCNKMLPCGQHRCQKTCHKGNCLEEDAVCTQPCIKPRSSCGHPCGAPCHVSDCPEDVCKTEISITCPCGNRTAKAPCSAGGDHSGEIAQFQRLSVQSIVESGGQGVDMSQFTQTKKSNKRLDCDTNCAIIERNRRLALALEIKNPDMNAKLGSPTFTEFLKDFAKKNVKFASNVEKSLTELVQSSKQSAQPSRSHPFQSMNRDQRRFVHELAEFYGCQTQSYDSEPNKNVVATAYKDKCWLPNIILTQVACKDQVPKAPPPFATYKTQGVTFTVLEKKKAVAKEPAPNTRAWEEAGATASKPTASIDYFDFTE